MTNRVRLFLLRWRRFLLAHRRGLAALSLGLGVALALQSQAPPRPRSVEVVVAARDLAGGAAVRAADLRVASFPTDAVPQGVLAAPGDAVGRTTVGPVRAGEPITDVRLLGPGLLAERPGSVAAPVRIGDADALDLVQAGDRVDLLAADPRRRDDAVLVAADVTVLAVPPGPSDPGLVPGGLLVVAVDDDTARRLAGLAVSAVLSVVLVR